MQIDDITKMFGFLMMNSFEPLSKTDYLFRKKNVSVAILGNSINAFYGDIVIKDWLNRTTKAFNNNNDNEYQLAVDHLITLGVIL